MLIMDNFPSLLYTLNIGVINMVDGFIGSTFERLRVVSFSRIYNDGKRNRKYWNCVCDCGNLIEVRKDVLTSGNCKSCGCLKKEKATINARKNHTHKMSGTRIYGIWQKMKDRCYNKNVRSYKDYGARGVVLCNDWLDPKKFIDWAIANGYEEKLSIDRIDNDGIYEPSNCKWSNSSEQARNRRSNILVNYQGKEITLTELSEITKLDYKMLNSRFRRGARMPELIMSPCQYRDNRKHHPTS